MKLDYLMSIISLQSINNDRNHYKIITCQLFVKPVIYLLLEFLVQYCTVSCGRRTFILLYNLFYIIYVK